MVHDTAVGDFLFSGPIPAMRWVANWLNAKSKKAA